MAVINKKTVKKQTRKSTALQALSTAAMVLPGMISTANAVDAEVTIQYGHYEEGERDVYSPQAIDNPIIAPGQFVIKRETKKRSNKLKPLQVDSMQLQAKVGFLDRLKFTANYTEDTWSGATPIATAPAGFGGNNAILRDDTTVSGASPYLQGLLPVFDTEFNPLRDEGLFFDPVRGPIQLYSEEKRLVHTLVQASPETRKQGDFGLTYEWDEASATVGGGISIENDYESRFVNWGGSLDFNNKLTTVSFNQSYTNSSITALIDHEVDGYVNLTGYRAGYQDAIKTRDGKVFRKGTEAIIGDREDWATSLGLTQILGKNTVMEAGVSYTRSTGFMENPYKYVSVFYIDPDQVQATPGVLLGVTNSFIEQRPDIRNQWTWNLRLVQHITPLNAALNINYRFFHDDWGINAHTIEADWVQPLGNGWTVTPTVRYYSQSEADFYTPYLIAKQAIGANEEESYDAVPEKHFSSDHRLSGYGALSGGIVINKQFAKGLNLQLGFEYYSHAGSLKLGGDGEDGFADFSSYSANAALSVDLSTLGRSQAYKDHAHHLHKGAPAPSGVMNAHMIAKAGDFMVGYRYMYGRRSGNMLQGDSRISDRSIVSSNEHCGGEKCFVKPNDMTMQMHMLNIMYAPTDWLNLMVMPTYVDKSMTMQSLKGASEPLNTSNLDFGPVIHANHEHMTGGLGDTKISALFKLFDNDMHHLHLGVGVSAPTGDVKIELRRSHGSEIGYIHYGMQIGSGTWDLLPSLTYTGQLDDFSWGAQMKGVYRLESRNDVGYSLGNMFESSVWGGYKVTNWLSFSLRGVYSAQGEIRGEYHGLHSPIGPMDTPDSYGGRYWDLGVGVSATVPKGDLVGNTLSVEWLQPLEDDVNGIQLERDGALSVNWGYMF